MQPVAYSWVLAGHLLSMVLWVGSLFTVYWLLRIHSHAPKDSFDRLTAMERSMALLMDLGATGTIACGLVLAFMPIGGGNWFVGHGPWLHVKLTIVVLGLLSVHGMVRGKVAKFSRGQIGPVPAWQWTLMLASVMAIIVVATTKLAVKDADDGAAPSAPAVTAPAPR